MNQQIVQQAFDTSEKLPDVASAIGAFRVSAGQNIAFARECFDMSTSSAQESAAHHLLHLPQQERQQHGQNEIRATENCEPDRQHQAERHAQRCNQHARADISRSRLAPCMTGSRIDIG
jgi:hypothetical protein